MIGDDSSDDDGDGDDSDDDAGGDCVKQTDEGAGGQSPFAEKERLQKIFDPAN